MTFNLVTEMADSAQDFLRAAGADADFEGVTGFISDANMFLYQFDKSELCGCILLPREQVSELIKFLQRAIALPQVPVKAKRKGPRS